ncbi:MAG TPA: NAD(P)H-hydrate dehydratase [Kofleriaceae bacterium]|nr:NAD(P)H-hydrate dehydratase [Kofleriaceae bacterium]
MQPVVTAAEMRALDRATIEEIGIPGFTLMETAGRAVADAAVAMLGGRTGHVAVVCGPGNNGGDGFVVARVLRSRGIDAVVYLAVARDALQGYAREHLDVLDRSGGVIQAIASAKQLEAHEAAIRSAALVVDALFGIGTTRPIEGRFAAIVETINATSAVLAVDIPSGLETDTGQTLGVAVRAQRTVTMAAPKLALVSAPGFARCGAVVIADIGIPPQLVAASNIRAGLVEPADIQAALPRATVLDHKGRRGHVLIVGGGPGMRGAGRLAATAAARAGAGLVTLAAAGDDLTAPDSIMTRPIRDREALVAALEGKAAVVIGPGLGTQDLARTWVGEVLASGVPAVLDADALNVLASDAAQLARAAGPVVITPHPGEAARLLQTTAAAVEADRLAAARLLAVKTHAVVVLKGARTIVCDGTLGDDFCAINPTGGPALATGGSGDVLAGTIGALLAQGVPAADAARVGAYVHGRAGDELAHIHGARGVVATDLPLAIADVLHSFE